MSSGRLSGIVFSKPLEFSDVLGGVRDLRSLSDEGLLRASRFVCRIPNSYGNSAQIDIFTLIFQT